MRVCCLRCAVSLSSSASHTVSRTASICLRGAKLNTCSQRERMECVATVAAGRPAGEAALAAASTVALHFCLIHLRISGPFMSYRSLAPPFPAACTVVTALSAASTCADERSEAGRREMPQVGVMVAACVHHQRGEALDAAVTLLHLAVRQLAVAPVHAGCT